MNIASEIEILTHDADNLRSVILATYDAIYCGSSSYLEYEGALNIAFLLSNDLMKKLNKLTDEVYKLQRKDK